jgi:hypothetical protein
MHFLAWKIEILTRKNEENVFPRVENGNPHEENAFPRVEHPNPECRPGNPNVFRE